VSRTRIAKRIIAGFTFLVFECFAGCRLSSSDAYPIVISSETFTLAWDAPSIQYPLPPLATSYYCVYYRRHGSPYWRICGTIPSSGTTEIVLYHSDYGNGAYDFAVSAVNEQGHESPLHTSLDPWAYPYGGWYVKWTRSD
jgi:hypothetical protein